MEAMEHVLHRDASMFTQLPRKIATVSLGEAPFHSETVLVVIIRQIEPLNTVTAHPHTTAIGGLRRQFATFSFPCSIFLLKQSAGGD